ncbi:MAG TPA: MlaD family protein [Baekduia sp.]|nr:MlaD family protein [Baekduia sp.]
MTRSATHGRLVLVLLIVIFLAFWASRLFKTNLDFRAGAGGTYEVTAVFEQVAGTTKGTEVRAGGDVVGRVQDISLSGKELLPHVKLVIDDDVRLRQGAVLDLRLYSNAGQLNRYIDITQGDGPELRDGATVGLALTDQPVEYDQVLRVLDRRTRGDVSAVLRRLDQATAGRGPDIEATAAAGRLGLGETAQLLEDISYDGRVLRTLLRQGDRVVSSMAEEPAALGGFADRLSGLLATTARRQYELRVTAERAAPAMREPRLALDRLNRAVPELRRLVSDARPAVRELRPFSRQLRSTLATARPTLGTASRLTASAPGNLRKVSGLLRTARPLLAPLTHALCRSGPILDMLRATAPDVYGGVQLFGAITSNYDANGHGARIFAHTKRVTGGEVEPDENTSGMVKPPFERVPGVNIDQPWREFRSSFIGGDGNC